MFCSSGCPQVMGEANCNLPVLIQILATALAANVISDDDVKARVLQFARVALVSLLCDSAMSRLRLA